MGLHHPVFRNEQHYRLGLLVSIQPDINGFVLDSGDKTRNPCCVLEHAEHSIVWNVPASQQLAAPPSSMVFFGNLANIAIVMPLRVLHILAKLAETEKGSTMRQFSATDLANKTGDVLAVAAQQPVAIARHGKRRFVVLSTEEFEALRQGKDSRTAHHVDDLDDAEATRLMTELHASIDKD